VEILKSFEILHCKMMATPMASNMKLLDDTTLWILHYTYKLLDH
jgi:hypothetical protein